MWATGTLCTARASRMLGPASVLAWVMFTGLVANLAVVAVGSQPRPLSGSDLALMLTAGVCNVLGLLMAYSALRHGKVGLVAPIISTEGAVAAVLAVGSGEDLGVASAWLLTVVAAGVVLAAAAPVALPVPGERKSTAVVLATLAALLFGVGLFATGRLSASLPVGWAMLPPRVVGVVGVTIPLVLTRRLRLTRPALPLVVTAGVVEVLGFLSYVVGARHGIAITAVLASQFAAISVVAAYVLFHERLTRLQFGGVGLIVVGVATLAAVRGS